MMGRPNDRRLFAGAMAIALSFGVAPAHAQLCAARKISATGATAQFAVLAKIAARTAWTSKVAADARLGAVYSTWLRGKDRRLVCRKVDNRHICLAIALPCRSATVLGQQKPAPSLPAPLKQRPL